MVVYEWILLCVVLAAIAVVMYYAFKPVPDQPESFTERPRVVVSFTTLPSRLPFLGEVSAQMAKQSFQPDAVYACIPTVSARLGKSYDLSGIDIPSNLTVIRTEDYGPATKLLGCLDSEPDPATIIITIDDDVDYSPDLLKTLVETALENPDSRIGSRATDRYHTKHLKKTAKTFNNPDIMLLGFGGIAYRRGMLSDSDRKWLQQLPSSDMCWKSDDITFDRLIGGSKIKVSNLVLTDVTDAEHVDALKDDKRNETYNQCYATMDSLVESR